MKRLPLVFFVITLTSCGGGSSPSTPTTPTPPAQTFVLSGGISETEPTTSNKIPGATVAFADGSNAGKSAAADGAGNYSIAGLQPGAFSLNIRASGYQDASRSVTISGNTTLNVQLRPNSQTLTATRNDNISGGDPPCSDGIFTDKGCKIVSLPVHNDGTISATLTWETSSTDLDLTLWRGTTLIAESRSATSRTETVSANVTGGATFELHVTYYIGSVITPFQLRLTYPN